MWQSMASRGAALRLACMPAAGQQAQQMQQWLQKIPASGSAVAHWRALAWAPASAPAAMSVHTSSMVDAPKMKVPASEDKLSYICSKYFNRVPKSQLMGYALNLSHKCMRDIDILAFFDRFDMPDSLYSWFLVSELHIWMLMVRFQADGSNEAKNMRILLVKCMWMEVELRKAPAKKLGGQTASERMDQILDMNDEFRAALLIYDAGLLNDDKALANAVWRRFFLSTQEPNISQVQELAEYVLRTITHLEKIDPWDLVSNKFDWLPLQVKSND